MVSTQVLKNQTKYGSLHKPTLEKDDYEDEKSFCDRWCSCFPARCSKELKCLSKLAAPVILIKFLQFGIFVTPVIFCGQLGRTELDAVFLAYTMTSTILISVANGVCTVCDTFFSQTFTSRNNQSLGIQLQRSVCVMMMAFFMFTGILLNTEGLLLSFGQDIEVSKLADRFVLLQIPGLFFFCLYLCLERFILCQDLAIPVLVIAGIGNLLNCGLHYLFCYYMDFRTNGSAVAIAITEFSLLVMIMMYIVFKGTLKSYWTGFSLEALKDWGMWIRLGIFGTLMLSVEWWTLEVGSIASGTLGTAALAVQSIAYNMEYFCAQLTSGLGIAAGIQIGHHLGAGDPVAARKTTQLAIFLAFCCSMFWGIIFILTGRYIPHIFTSDKEIINHSIKVLPMVALYITLDISGISIGILRGCGKQMTGSICVSIAHSVGLTIAIPLMLLTPLSVTGFWIGLIPALIIKNILYHVIIWRIDWDDQIILAGERTEPNYNDNVSDKESPDYVNGSANDEITLNAVRPRRDRELENNLTNSTCGEEFNKMSLVSRRLTVIVPVLVIFFGGTLVRLFILLRNT